VKTLSIKDAVHKKLKIEAAQRGITIEEVAEEKLCK